MCIMQYTRVNQNMLKLVDIKKNYVMKDQEPVRALRGITLNFRKSEFVAILGPSGCGKTTLLNIVGGLDRYSDGDLIIKGKSTKNYNDRDWDTYRNHSIGFVFQAYNLIGHQSVQKNVELALTIGGVDRKERKERALKALEKVGLKGMEKKRPNQLSGGQMQRVAIARALINNPEILLADEPTGALDSETSVQIMDLLKEVANDRLVIMVTHNPDLANKYATRIVNMFDGVITGDTNPYDGNEVEKKKKYRCPKCGAIVEEKFARCPNCQVLAKYPDDDVNKGKKKNSSMSFLTAASLSLANLFSKSKRTILVAIAGSIGIFGVSTVLAASYGVRHYISDMQDDMLSSYPLTIQEQSIDYMTLMTGLYNDTDTKIMEFDTTTEVGLNSMIDYLVDKYSDLTSVKTNTINDDLVEFVKEIPEEYVSAISYEYGVDVTNNIFTSWKENADAEPIMISLNGLTQRYIAELQTVSGFSQYASYFDLFTDFMNLLPGDEDYILSQYDLLGDSHFPKNENEIMLVVGDDTTLTDLVYAQLGYYNGTEFLNLTQKSVGIHNSDHELSEDELKEYDEKYPYPTSFKYEDVLNKKFYYYPHDTIYEYNDIPVRPYKDYSIVLKTASNDEFYTFNYSDTSQASTYGIFYTGAHIKVSPFSYESVYLIKLKDGVNIASLDFDNISEALADPKTDPDPSSGTFIGVSAADLRKLMSGSSATPSSLFLASIQPGNDTTATITSTNPFGFAQFTCNKTITDQMETVTGYQYPAEAQESWGQGTELSIAGILRPKKGIRFGCLSRGVYYTKDFQKKYMNDAKNSQIITDETRGFEAYISSGAAASDYYRAYVTFNYTDWTDSDHPIKDTFGYASCLNGDFTNSFTSIFSSITGVDYSSQNGVFLRSLSGLKFVSHTDAEDNITYTYEELPESMSIYPVNFEMKDKVTEYLDKWNSNEDIVLYDGTAQEKTLTKDNRDELTYNDTISLIITAINTMITIITVALIVFTSLSLIVSSFMIAVITYISVMERVKEIGVIRSLGGRKKDVSRLFIAENFVTGVMSGVIGVIITYIACIIINLVVSPFGIPRVAILIPTTALLMIGLSVFLSVLSGLIPSMHASRQDPVIALRSE